MALKEAKELELLPRVSSSQKKIFSALTNNGISTVLEIAKNSGVTKGRVPAALERLQQRGLVIEIKTDADEPKYAAVYPIKRFTRLLDTLISSLKARNDELEAIKQLVNDFNENAINDVREASTKERQKRDERSEEDIKDLEMAMDASFSGTLASVEMDLKDLGKIAKTSNEFLVGSSIRTQETCQNIKKGLVPLNANFLKIIEQTRGKAQELLEKSVDTRVSRVLDFETNAFKAFSEVLDAFSDSQDAFEEVIFSVLDSGIEDLEKVTRPINDQIEETINSLKLAIQDASNNFQTEILRVLTEQKRPLTNTVESLRPKIAKKISESNDTMNEILDVQYQDLIESMENHTAIFSEATELLAKEFDNKITNLVKQTQDNIATSRDEVNNIEQTFTEKITSNTESKNTEVHMVSNKTRDILSTMNEQFTDILNRSVAQYQMELSDLITNLETDFLVAVENNGTSVENLVNYINISLTQPVRELMTNLDELDKKIQQDEAQFLEKFDDTLISDLQQITEDFEDNSNKSEKELVKEIKRINNRFSKEIDKTNDSLKDRLDSSQKNLRNIFDDFSKNHQKELRSTSKDIDTLRKKLERWRGESTNHLSKQVDYNVNRSMDVLESEIDEIIAKIESSDEFSKEEIIKVVKESYQDISKSFKGFGNNVSGVVRKSLNEIASTLKKDSLKINNRLVSFKKEQDRLVEETKKPAYKLFDEISKDYKELHNALQDVLEKFFDEELKSFKKNRKELGKTLKEIMNRRGVRTSKDIITLQEGFERARENYVKKTERKFQNIERRISKNTEELIENERTSRTTITRLTEKIISDLYNGANTTKENLLTNLWDGSEKIYNQATSNISKMEIELNTLNDRILDETLKETASLTNLVKEQIDLFKTKTTVLQDKQIGDIHKFKDEFTSKIEEDLNTKLDDLQRSREELRTVNDKLVQVNRQVIDTESMKAIQELEAKTSGIEGAIFSTVGNITSEAARRTEGVVVIGEQAVLGIEERYTENLERIRQNLTDEVIGRIGKEAGRIEVYKDNFRTIGRNHAKIYGDEASTINQQIADELTKAEKMALKIFNACENISCRYLEELNSEINAMGNRVGISTERLTSEILDDFDRVFQKVKREVGLFARMQFELSNKSTHEIAETFLKTVDDLEEVMIKQIENYTKRTNKAISRTNEVSSIVNDHIKDISESFKEALD